MPDFGVTYKKPKRRDMKKRKLEWDLDQERIVLPVVQRNGENKI